MTQQELIENCQTVAMDLYSNDMECSFKLLEQVIQALENAQESEVR